MAPWIKKVLKIGDSLIFVVPAGMERICFNAHRVYSHDTVISWFEGFEFVDFQLVQSDEFGGPLVRNPTEHILRRQIFVCCFYWFKKK